MKQFVTREHEIEPIPGLPGVLPAGETILWQGRPASRLVARQLLKVRWVGFYFLLLAAWAAWAGFSDGHPAAGILFSVAVLTALAGVLIGMLELFAWGVEKTTLYTITTERVVMRFGVALSMTLNLPYKQINTAAVSYSDGDSGSIAIDLMEGHRLSWLVQWPHVRGWRFAKPEPSLICLADAREASDVLAAAINQYRESGASRMQVVRRTPRSGQAAPVGVAAE